MSLCVFACCWRFAMGSLTEECFSRHDTQNQEYQEDHQEHEEQHLGDAGCAGGDVREAESGSDERDEKEEQGPAQHVTYPCCIGARRSASRPGAVISIEWPSCMAILAAAAVASKAASLVA